MGRRSRVTFSLAENSRVSSRWRRSLFALCVGSVTLLGCRTGASPARATTDAGTWWKGNTHTHTLWSDGDDFPEMVADWYKRNGYHFVSLTDHNTLAADERWWPVSPTPLGREVHQKYQARFGNWVEERLQHDSAFVRLRNPREYRSKFEEAGKFTWQRTTPTTITASGRPSEIPDVAGSWCGRQDWSRTR